VLLLLLRWELLRWELLLLLRLLFGVAPLQLLSSQAS